MEEERRRHKRLETGGIDIKFKFGTDEKEYKAKMMNVSGGGTCFEVDLELERLNVSVPSAPETIKPHIGGPSIKLNLREQEQYSILRGQGRIDVMNQPLKFYIRDIMRMGFFEDLAAEDKKKLLENTIDDLGKATELQMYRDSTRLRQEHSMAIDRQNRIKMFYK